MDGRALEIEKEVIKARERAKILARSKSCFMKSLSIFLLMKRCNEKRLVNLGTQDRHGDEPTKHH